MTTHTCSYHCTRPECVLRQRDELRERGETLRSGIDWVRGLDVEGWPPFHEFTAAGYRYRWRSVLADRLREALEG